MEIVLQALSVLGFNVDLMERYGLRVLEGAVVTLELVAVSMAAGFILAFPLAIARVEGNALIRGLATGYVTFFRGTPLLAQTFLVYYGGGQFRDALEAAGLWWLFRDAFFCALLTFALNTCAYQAEILRGGMAAVSLGQREAARALGLRTPAIYLHIILPQAVRVGLRPLGNELILMIKSSSIASVITVYDLMGTTRLAFNRSWDFEVYLWAAALYLLMVEAIRNVWNLLEKRLNRHLVRQR